MRALITVDRECVGKGHSRDGGNTGGSNESCENKSLHLGILTLRCDCELRCELRLRPRTEIVHDSARQRLIIRLRERRRGAAAVEADAIIVEFVGDGIGINSRGWHRRGAEPRGRQIVHDFAR